MTDQKSPDPKTIAQAAQLFGTKIDPKTDPIYYLTKSNFFEKSVDDQIKTEINPDQAAIAYALALYEEIRMKQRPKPKFILEIKDNYFHAKRSRATLWDVLFVAVATATWLALLASIYLVFK